MNTTTFTIENAIITLHNKEINQGSISIKNKATAYSYEMYWGAMGGTIEEFLISINSDYFTDKLLGKRSMQVFDARGTFKNLRKFIREELDLPWYKHLDFQKDLREKLHSFQERCDDFNSSEYFVENFSHFVQYTLNYYRISDDHDRSVVEEAFNSISEPWEFLDTKYSSESKWLIKLHSKIKKKLIKEKNKKR